MEELTQLDELLGCRTEGDRREVSPCTLVIFGASGDLTSRKLIPALYHLFCGGQLPEPFRIVGVARREKTAEPWRAELKDDLARYARSKEIDETVWGRFERLISYCRGDLTDSNAYEGLKARLQGFGDQRLEKNLLFYLAISPSQFAETVKRLHAHGMVRKDAQDDHWQRVVIEKPFGHDLASARN